MNRATPLVRTAERLVVVVLLIALWWFASAGSTSVFFPPLSTILDVLWRDLTNGVLPAAAVFSLTNLFLGLLIALVIGVVLGVVIGETERFRLIVDPIIHFARSVPQAALVPLIIGAFGLGAGPKVYSIALATVWPILLNTIDGVRGLDPSIRRVSRSFLIPSMLHFRRVVLPAAMPQIAAGFRVALPIGITVMVVSELFAANKGLGFYILNSASTFRLAETWAGAIVVGIIGYVLALLFVVFERRALAWYFTSGAK
ncbi:ABC transporter permease [Microbacterium sp.]|uniref:ABC transporter permease n=1 Tax=Microbacterium sp. TaxID=51671 RepID=UPI003A8BA4F9